MLFIEILDVKSIPFNKPYTKKERSPTHSKQGNGEINLIIIGTLIT